MKAESLSNQMESKCRGVKFVKRLYFPKLISVNDNWFYIAVLFETQYILNWG